MSRNNFKNEARKNYRLNQHELRLVFKSMVSTNQNETFLSRPIVDRAVFFDLKTHLREVKRISKQISTKMRRMSAEIYPENKIYPWTRRFKLFYCRYFRFGARFRFIFEYLIGFLFGIWTWLLKKLRDFALFLNCRPKRGLGGSKLKTL